MEQPMKHIIISLRNKHVPRDQIRDALVSVHQDPGNSDSADENIEEGGNSNETGKDSQDKSDTVWYYKLPWLIDH
eukprot:889227-Ditylum_brightwellii.AAC.1